MQEWVTERLEAILEGRSSEVAGGMRRSATLQQLDAEARQRLDPCANYLLLAKNGTEAPLKKGRR